MTFSPEQWRNSAAFFRKMKNRSALFLVGVIFAAAVSASGQARTARSIKVIDKYAASIDKTVDSRSRPDIVAADTAAIDAAKPAWKIFDSVDALEKAGTEDDTYTIAYSWKKDDKLVASRFTYSSPSGDWAEFVFHYFRADGSLARVDAELRTFTDDCVIRQSFYFNSSGKSLKRTRRYFDLNTDKPRKPCLGANALKFEYFKTAAALPFAASLK